jgi:uncharacterized protein YyaL (SSP411 family)
MLARIGFTFALIAMPLLVGAAEPAAKIAWYGTLQDGLQEAKRSQRPVLLVAGAPHCHGVSGVW